MLLSPVTTYDLSGRWSVSTDEQKVFNMKLPGTLDENNIGPADNDAFLGELDLRTVAELDPMDPFSDLEEPLLLDEDREVIKTRLSRRHAYRGEARIHRLFSFQEHPHKRLFFEVERARSLKLLIDGEEIPPFSAETFVTPHVFEVTGKLDGNHLITLISSNVYEGPLGDELLASNMASDDTQTNWNGLLGYVRLREEEEAFIAGAEVSVDRNSELTVMLEISALSEAPHSLKISANALELGLDRTVDSREGLKTVTVSGLKLKKDARKWDENSPFLHELRIFWDGKLRTVDFGIRDFSASADGLFFLNGRRIFLRGETNFGVFPETGYMPTDVKTWDRILRTYRSYGANFVYFHAACPPDAAFEAADTLGMLLMPELSIAHSVGALEDRDVRTYYRDETGAILKYFGSHPSFVLLGLGQMMNGTEVPVPAALSAYISYAAKLDPTKFFVSAGRVYSGREVSARAPKLLFFAGRHELPPDFREIDLFSGFSEPGNIIAMRDAVISKKLFPYWDKYAAAGGEQALRLYQRDVEEALLDERLAGIVLAGLQDLPGFGNHLFGMMNSHLVPKHYPYADNRRFAQFFAQVLPVAVFSKPIYEAGEEIQFRLSLVNYGTESVKGALSYVISDGEAEEEHTFDFGIYEPGTVSFIGNGTAKTQEDAGMLTVSLKLGLYENSYRVPVVPKAKPGKPDGILECTYPDEAVLMALGQGANVLMIPSAPLKRANLPMVTADFKHPLLSGLPLEAGDLRFFERLLTNAPALFGRKLKLPLFGLSFEDGERIPGYIAEFQCRSGNVLFTTIPLHRHQDKPEGRALLKAIYDYMSSYDFSPSGELRPEELRQVVETVREESFGRK